MLKKWQVLESFQKLFLNQCCDTVSKLAVKWDNLLKRRGCSVVNLFPREVPRVLNLFPKELMKAP